MQRSESSTKTRKRPPRARSGPQSGGDPPASDGDDTGRVAYEDLFGTPALEEQQDTGAAEVWGDPDAEPITIPSLRFTAFPPERILYAAAYRAAYKYPDALMLVMNGIRKGLERGQKAAESRGDNR